MTILKSFPARMARRIGWKTTAFLLTLSIVASLVAVTESVVAGTMIRLVAAGSEETDAKAFYGMLALYAVLIAAPTVLATVKDWWETRIRMRLPNESAIELTEKQGKLAYAVHENQQAKQELRFVSNNGFRLWQLSSTYLGLSANVFGCLSGGIALLAISPLFFCLVAAGALPQYLVYRHVAAERFLTQESLRPDRMRQGYFSWLFDGTVSIGMVKLFVLEKHLVRTIRSILEGIISAELKTERRAMVKLFFASLVSLLMYTTVYITATYLTWSRSGFWFATWNERVFDIGTWTMVLGLTGTFRASLAQLCTSLGVVAENRSYIERLEAVLGMEEEGNGRTADLSSEKTLRFELQDVWFRYPTSEEWALRGISFSVSSDELVGLLGDNGSGKSTLTKLLCGWYKPTRGRILVNGVDLETVRLPALYSLMGVLQQDVMLFEAVPVAAAIGRECTDRDRIMRAARLAGADEFIRRLPQGYDTMLGTWFGGVALSGGERQKIALASLICREPVFAILDEPTSSIDFRGKLLFKKTISSLSKSTGFILAAHEPIILDIVRRIIVLEGGEIKADGRHEDIMEDSSYYREMVTEYRAALSISPAESKRLSGGVSLV